MNALRSRRLTRAAQECRNRLEHLRLHDQIDAYVDGELTGHRRLRMAAHLAICFACSSGTETLRLVKHSLANSPQRAPAQLAQARLRRFTEHLLRSGPTRPT
jgi:anti-sigma factor RsiW